MLFKIRIVSRVEKFANKVSFFFSMTGVAVGRRAMISPGENKKSDVVYATCVYFPVL